MIDPLFDLEEIGLEEQAIILEVPTITDVTMPDGTVVKQELPVDVILQGYEVQPAKGDEVIAISGQDTLRADYVIFGPDDDRLTARRALRLTDGTELRIEYAGHWGTHAHLLLVKT